MLRLMPCAGFSSSVLWLPGIGQVEPLEAHSVSTLTHSYLHTHEDSSENRTDIEVSESPGSQKESLMPLAQSQDSSEGELCLGL
ncbi:hypothetical protein RUM44_000336 [Polyplax serrata]|uniref:Uncharacterized protein n=1 Tax=Polyplax serrata TaxID=468196 RepID=A0ABR1B6G5_POLSC